LKLERRLASAVESVAGDAKPFALLAALQAPVGPSVDKTGARNIASQIAFGVPDRRAQQGSACLRLSMKPTHAGLVLASVRPADRVR
jgi:hypothetical protein